MRGCRTDIKADRSAAYQNFKGKITMTEKGRITKRMGNNRIRAAGEPCKEKSAGGKEFNPNRLSGRHHKIKREGPRALLDGY